MSEKKIQYRLKGHEKFSLRDGWLNKGLTAVQKDHNVFLGTNGSVELGVGNNMVKSIRYWIRSFGLTHEAPGKGAHLTNLGELILKHDQYFEDIFTLWLLHSKISKNFKDATSWYLFFNKCDLDEFTKDEIKVTMSNELYKYIGDRNYPESSVKDDVDVLLNMYYKEKTEDYDPEDKNISPLTGLGLIKKNKDVYFRRQPDIHKLSEWIILYELIELFGNEKSISIDDVAFGEKSIGNIYNLSRVTLNDYLDKLESMSYIKVVRTAGLDVIYKTTEFSDPNEIIEEYYNNHKVR